MCLDLDQAIAEDITLARGYAVAVTADLSDCIQMQSWTHRLELN